MRARGFLVGTGLALSWAVTTGALDPGVRFAPGSVPGDATLARPVLAVGERLSYGVTVGRLRLGKGALAVEEAELIEGVRAYRASLEIEIGAPMLKFRDRQVSWIATEPYRSLAFERQLRKSGGARRRYRFDHEFGTYEAEDLVPGSAIPVAVTGDDGAGAIPDNALDAVATLYLLRSLPLEVGQVFRLDRYFELTKNPMVLRVIGHEKIRVPAGRFRALVIEPDIPALSMFRPEKEARIYVSDDERRLILKMTTKTKAGTTTFYLTDYEAGERP